MSVRRGCRRVGARSFGSAAPLTACAEPGWRSVGASANSSRDEIGTLGRTRLSGPLRREMWGPARH